MGNLMNKLQDIWDKGQEAGANKMLMEQIEIKLNKGKTVSQIAFDLEMTRLEVDNLLSAAQKEHLKLEKTSIDLYNEKIDRAARLGMLREIVVHMVKESGFEFDELQLVIKLNEITDVKRLQDLGRLAAKTNSIESFFELLSSPWKESEQLKDDEDGELNE